MSRLVDPIHLFNHLGESVLSNAHLTAEVERLTRELERAKSERNTLARRLRAIAEEN